MPVDGVLMQLGRAYDKAGKTADAIRAFTRIGDEFPESPYAGDAKTEADRLKARSRRGLSCAVSHGIVRRRRPAPPIGSGGLRKVPIAGERDPAGPRAARARCLAPFPSCSPTIRCRPAAASWPA